MDSEGTQALVVFFRTLAPMTLRHLKPNMSKTKFLPACASSCGHYWPKVPLPLDFWDQD